MAQYSRAVCFLSKCWAEARSRSCWETHSCFKDFFLNFKLLLQCFLKLSPKYAKSIFLKQKQPQAKLTVGYVAIFPDKISPIFLKQPPRLNREAEKPQGGWGPSVKTRLVNYIIPELAAEVNWDHTACHTMTSACLSWGQQSSPGQALSGGIGVEKYFLK